MDESVKEGAKAIVKLLWEMPDQWRIVPGSSNLLKLLDKPSLEIATDEQRKILITNNKRLTGILLKLPDARSRKQALKMGWLLLLNRWRVKSELETKVLISRLQRKHSFRR